MKKTMIPLLLITIVALSFTSCNADASAGLFRQISQSTASIDITYRQLLGYDTAVDKNLYFRTIDGLYRIPKSKTSSGDSSYTKEELVANTNGSIVQASAFYAATDQLFYFTDNTAERDANQIRVIDTTNLAASTMTVTFSDTSGILSDLKIKNLYANSMILVFGKDASAANRYELLAYNGTTAFNVPIASFSSAEIASYSIDNVIQQTTKENDSTADMIVSFVHYDSTGSVYKHFLVDPTTPSVQPLPDTKVQIANFFIDSNNGGHIYVLTTDGILYYAGTNTTPAVTYTEMEDISKKFDPNAFIYPIDDGTNIHLITKPTTKSYPLYVFTFPRTATNGNDLSTVSIKYGYGEYLDSANIIGALQINSSLTDLLVATHENGIFKISINAASANVNSIANGESSTSEKYTF